MATSSITEQVEQLIASYCDSEMDKMKAKMAAMRAELEDTRAKVKVLEDIRIRLTRANANLAKQLQAACESRREMEELVQQHNRTFRELERAHETFSKRVRYCIDKKDWLGEEEEKEEEKEDSSEEEEDEVPNTNALSVVTSAVVNTLF